MNQIPSPLFPATETRVGKCVEICESDFPLAPALKADRAALAVIVGVDGPSYRPVGAAMVVNGAGRSWGSLSSGCIERDVILHARAAIESGRGEWLHYGRGSPFVDLRLPCGGSLDIQIIPLTDREALRVAAEQLVTRESVVLSLASDGRIAPLDMPAGLTLIIRPQIRFLVFGKGPETRCFVGLARQAGYPVELFSPDPETLADISGGRLLTSAGWPEGVNSDARTAVVLFFHEHDREPPLLDAALAGPAFFVGAQGSLRAHDVRRTALAARGVSIESINRLASPFGLIPSARDPRTLAVSVLAHVLQRAADGACHREDVT